MVWDSSWCVLFCMPHQREPRRNDGGTSRSRVFGCDQPNGKKSFHWTSSHFTCTGYALFDIYLTKWYEHSLHILGHPCVCSCSCICIKVSYCSFGIARLSWIEYILQPLPFIVLVVSMMNHLMMYMNVPLSTLHLIAPSDFTLFISSFIYNVCSAPATNAVGWIGFGMRRQRVI